MSDNWIKVRTVLLDDPAVMSLAVMTGLDEFGVVGRLVKLWSWADSQTTDGNARIVTNVTVSALQDRYKCNGVNADDLAKRWMDRYLGCEGISDALIAVGWLSCDGSGLHIPNFDKHNSQSSKQRAVTSKRVTKHRKQPEDTVTVPALQDCYKCNGESVTDVTVPPLPEKRREEKKNTHTQETPREEFPHSDWTPEEVQAWQAWIECWVHRNKGQRPQAFVLDQWRNELAGQPGHRVGILRLSIEKNGGQLCTQWYHANNAPRDTGPLTKNGGPRLSNWQANVNLARETFARELEEAKAAEAAKAKNGSTK